MIEPEEGVISALMVDPQAVEKVCGMLSPDMFENGMLGRAYLEYVRAYDKGKELTLAELQQALTTEYMPFEVEETLNRVLDSRLTSTMIEGSARAIVNRYKKSCVDRVLTTTLINESTVDDQIDGLIKDLESLRSGEVSEGHTVADIAKEYQGKYFCDNNDKKIVLLGDAGLDNMIGGFEGGDLIYLASRPSVGKSALAMQWTWMFANQGLRVSYYNCEMQEATLFQRFIASETGISTTRIRLAKAFQGEEEEKYRRAVDKLMQQDRIIVFTGTKSINEIQNEVKLYKPDIVVVDYLQLLRSGDRYRGNKVAEVSELSWGLKTLAMKNNIPVLALSQLSRGSESRPTREPQLYDLRDSGSLEQDASIVMFLWNPDDTDKTQKAFKTAKVRNGVLDRRDFVFDGTTLSFKAESDITPFDGR